MSQFLSVSREEDNRDDVIDFESLSKLPGGGTTCDVYKTRWQRRTVFIKRLKENLRSKPLYVDAFDKEFEVGASLNHPSLPLYLSHKKDYIVINFIEGDTLAEMIGRKDPWLAEERHIIRMLRELVDVVGYLHRRNVVHCDIKADNIMITHNGRNLMLIDLDKCYTDALNDSAGDPRRYGLAAENVGSMSVDFKGVARVVEQMKESVPNFRFKRYNGFQRACHRPDVTAEELLAILDYKAGKPSRGLPGRTAVILSIIIIGVIALVYFSRDDAPKEKENQIAFAPEPAVSTGEKVPPTDSGYVNVAEMPFVRGVPADSAKLPAKKEPSSTVADDRGVTPNPINVRTNDEIQDEARRRAAILDKRIKPYYDELYRGLDQLKNLMGDNSLTSRELLDNIRRFSAKEEEVNAEVAAIIGDLFPGLNEREFARVIAYSTVCREYNRRSVKEQKAFGQEIERRYRNENSESAETSFGL